MVDEVPGQQRPEHDQDQQHPERARLYARARRIDDDVPCVLTVTQRADGRWSITGHGGEDLPAHGVRVPDDVMVLLAQQIMKRSR